MWILDDGRSAFGQGLSFMGGAFTVKSQPFQAFTVFSMSQFMFVE